MHNREYTDSREYNTVDKAGLLAMMRAGATLSIVRGGSTDNVDGTDQFDWYVLARRPDGEGGKYMLVATRKRAEAGVRQFKRFGSADSIVHFFQTLGVRGEITLPIVSATEIAQTGISMPSNPDLARRPDASRP